MPPIVEWCAALNPREPPPRHTIPIFKAIQKAVYQQQKLLIEMPPGHSKTTSALKSIAWWLKCFPADTNGYFTYNDHKGWSKSRLARQYAQIGGVVVDPRADSVAEWRTPQGGGLFAGGVGGGLTGERIKGIIFVDDPFKNRKEAESATIRQERWDWIMEVLITRLFQGATPVVMHTRWHPEDPIGMLKERPGWTCISLPAFAEPGDALGRAEGEALWPEMFPASELTKTQNEIGPWSWASLYQQRPRPRGLAVFEQPSFHDPAEALNGGGWRIFIAADVALTEDTKADWTVMGAMAARGVDDKMEGRLLDVVRGQWEAPEVARRLLRFSQQYGGGAVGVEAVGGFKAVPQILRSIDPGLRVIEIHPTVDKFLRAQPASAAYNQGRLTLPIGAPWVPVFTRELAAFTGKGGDHDDQVDMVAHLWNMAAAAMRRLSRPAMGSVADPGRWM